MFFIYNFLLIFTAPFWGAYVFYLIKKSKGKIVWQQLTGEYFLPKSQKPRVWFHAVSVGEVIAAVPILKQIKSLYSDCEIVLTVTTQTGHETAIKQTEGIVDYLFYFPLDIARFQWGAMMRIKPKVVTVMETELWMNFLWAAKASGAKTLVVNGRLSDRSFPRAIKIKPFYASLLKNLDAAYVQTDIDKERFKALGASYVEILGNCKYDQAAEIPQVDVEKWKSDLYISSEKKIIVLGTTRSRSEEKMILNVLNQLNWNDIHVIHAPRHMDHVPEIIHDLESAGISYSRRSHPVEHANYTLLDTFGELAQVYGLADIVILAGTFENHGGSNLMQPLAMGKPVVHGPSMENFAEASAAAHQAGATIIVQDEHQLKQELLNLLENSDRRKEIGKNAFEFVQQNLGASKRYAEKIVQGLLQ